MMNRQVVTEELIKSRVIAVLRAPDHDTAAHLVESYVNAGIKAIELTTSIPDWESLLWKVCIDYQDKAFIGLGTVVCSDDAQIAIDADAKFIVSPFTESGVIEVSNKNDVTVIPGALTPTEIAEAFKTGADMVKVFPVSSVGGSKYLKAVLAPMPEWKLIPTGGVTPENSLEYFKAGAVAVGLGSNLAPQDKVVEKNWAAVTASVEKFLKDLNKNLEDIGK